MAVDLLPLHNAVARLAEGISEYADEPSKSLLRDGLIQRFEVAYDLAVKMLRRVLALRSDSADAIDRSTLPSLFRVAFEQGVVDVTWPIWLDFRKQRNITSHTYDEASAIAAAELIPRFLVEVRELARRLEQANDG